jgi:hypothetical protein
MAAPMPKDTKEKAKAVPLHATKAVGVRGVLHLLIFDLDSRWGEWSASRPGHALDPEKGPPVPNVQEAGLRTTDSPDSSVLCDSFVLR